MGKRARLVQAFAWMLAFYVSTSSARAQASTPVVIPVGSFPQGAATDPVSTTALVTNAGDNTVSVIDLVNARVTATLVNIPTPAGVCFNASGLAVVANRSNNSVTVVEVAARRILGVVNVGTAPIGVAVHPGSNVAVVANSLGNSVSLVDVASSPPRLLATIDGIPNAVGIQSVAVDPDLNVAAVASSTTNSLFIVDLASRRISRQIPVEQSPWSVAIEPSSKTAVVANLNSNSVSLIDLRTYTVRATVPSIPTPQAVAIGPSAQSALVTTGTNATLQVVNLPAAAVETTVSNLPNAGSVAFHPSTGRTIVVLPNSNSAAVIASLGLFSSVNAASFAGGPVAPSSIASGFGSSLAASTAWATAVPLPWALADVSVRVGGVPAPLFFVSPQQVNYQVPRLGAGTYIVQVFPGAQQVAS